MLISSPRSGNNKFRTNSLFLEYNTTDPQLCLGPEDAVHDGKVIPSLYKYYMLLADPTEYKVAIKVLGSWKHWEALLKNTTLVEKYISKWREELDLKLRADGVNAIIDIATDEGGDVSAAQKFQAAKWLADRGWLEVTEGSKRGRPPKDNSPELLKEEVRSKRDISKDMKRLGIALVKSADSNADGRE